MPRFKQSFILAALALTVISACSAKPKSGSVPFDFAFMLDADSRAINPPEILNVNIKIDAQGRGSFEYYDNGGMTSYTSEYIVTYEPDEVVKSGKFRLTDSELKQLWDTLNENRFFELDERYEAQVGYSYAFILVNANGKRYIVNNIGVEVPEIRAIVEGVDEILPSAISMEYRQGFTP